MSKVGKKLRQKAWALKTGNNLFRMFYGTKKDAVAETRRYALPYWLREKVQVVRVEVREL